MQRTDVPDSMIEMMQVAKFVSASKMLPNHLIGDEASILTTMLAARSLDIPMWASFQEIIVQKGKVSMTSHLMQALVAREGYMIVPIEEECNEQGAKVRVYRPGIGKDRCGHADVKFDLNDAIRAQLLTKNSSTGKLIARSSKGEPLPWEKYTPDMMLWRAVSRAARTYFADVLMGMNYTPEEIGATVDEDGRPVKANAVRVEDDPHAVDLSLKIAAVETSAELRIIWQEAKNRGLLEAEVNGVTILQRVNLRLKDLPHEPEPTAPEADAPVDAETVDEAGQDTPDPEQSAPEAEQDPAETGQDETDPDAEAEQLVTDESADQDPEVDPEWTELVSEAEVPLNVEAQPDPEDTRVETPRRLAVENALSQMFEKSKDLEAAARAFFNLSIDEVSTVRLQEWAQQLRADNKGGNDA
jgi:hypothetical protein